MTLLTLREAQSFELWSQMIVTGTRWTALLP
jgi:hypothetical protein